MSGMTTTAHPQVARLLAGDFPTRFMTVTIEAGQVQPAGAALGEVTASSEYKLSATGAGDGSETPSVVLWEDVDASGGAVEAEVLICGDVRFSELTLGSGHTETSVKKAFRSVSLFVR
ncbi:head decoration protein [Halomonas sabkhae]|uniref:head decoration protein n=1 Tax=Halomonas sabkhae TaxID=626223 RepID=UPI0025B41C40|nr:head decoration protein [Halomonas sabkhae]MDN3525643.1 head decoration protein [Halomonas sabkhae]